MAGSIYVRQHGQCNERRRLETEKRRMAKEKAVFSRIFARIGAAAPGGIVRSFSALHLSYRAAP